MRSVSQYLVYFLFLFLIGADLKAQIEIPRDTTYTVSGTYKKLKEQHPTIQLVRSYANADIVQQNDVVYTTLQQTGRTLTADLFYPRKVKRKLPGVLLVHGGGWRSGDKSMNTPLARQLVLAGFVVMSVEYQLSLEAKYPAAVHNLKAAIRWLRSKANKYSLDEGRIAIVGGSAGGQLASLIGATNENTEFEGSDGYPEFSSSVQAVVDLDGLLDFTNGENLAVKRNDYSADVFWLGGFYDSIPDRWKEASPITHVSASTPPFLFINSSQTRFHAGCKEMVEKLQALGIKAEVVQLEDAPHSYWFFEPWFTPMTEHIVTFLNQTLKKK